MTPPSWTVDALGPVSRPDDLAQVLRRARAMVFDFDGTLVDSNPIKWRAFETCFRDLGPEREPVLRYCRSHDHVPRREKFQHIYDVLLRQPLTTEREARLQETFEAETTGRITQAPEIPGASAWLDRIAGRGPIALLSNTPQDPLERIVEGRGWRWRFDLIRGAPVRKADWLRRFAGERGLAGVELLYFGDTVEDAHAAREADCGFLALGDGPVRRAVAYGVSDFLALVDAWDAALSAPDEAA